MCEDNYIFNTSSKICTPRCITNDDCRNIQGQYCDQQTHMCTPCGSFCSACVSSDFCYTCTSTYHTLTTAGLCTAGCTYLQDGQYCKDGKAEPCAGGIESACKCGQYQNCATCSQDGYCTSCLTNYMQDMFGACSQCAYGYEMNESICIPIQFTHQASGVCSLTSLTCRAGYFCPAKDYNLVQCLPCNNNMAYGESCYCQDSIPTNNCIECAGGQCTGLLYVHNDHTMAENNCRPGCQICDYYQNCIQCDETHYIDYSTLICYEKCNTNQECAGPEPRYCDPDSMTCRQCLLGCLACGNKYECYKCDPLHYVTTIAGFCAPKCDNLPIGHYCNNGKPEPCAQGITSMCNCGTSQNCATCNFECNTCDLCLTNATNYNNQCLTKFDLDQMYQQSQLVAQKIMLSDPLTARNYLGPAAAVVIFTVCIGVVLYFVQKRVRKNTKVTATAIN
uniref:Cysteine-rich membrane protein 1 n=1 Tax=Spironucleus salmonicida TaxID=348837 RepID=V6LTP1_9EUKA|eukprot:EST47955.1 Cysteine-rich membrane protein 1 [Spironucleus salmonicida]